jgi:hypothetical protein
VPAPEEVSERMAEVFAIRLLDALDGNGPHGVRLIVRDLRADDHTDAFCSE